MNNNKTFASNVKYLEFCKWCEKVSNTPKRASKKLELIEKFFSVIRNHLKGREANDGFYPFLRLLLPHLDKDRPAYGIKESRLANLYVKILCLDKNSADAQKLLNYKLPKVSGCGVGDFAEVAYHVLKNRCPLSFNLSIEDVNIKLDSIAYNHINQEQAALEENLLFLIRNMSALEQKWLIRIILKNLRLGISQSAVLKSFHPDAEDLYDVTYSLSKISSVLYEPTFRLHEIEINLFTPFRPMLAERSSLKTLPRFIVQGSFYIETKLDGERIQLHMKENHFQYFSRRGFDQTDVLGKTFTEGGFTPFIIECFSTEVSSIILDGEMIGWNPKTHSVGCKGENLDLKSLCSHETYQLCFYVFDILLLNHHVLTNLPLEHRLQTLHNVVNPVPGRLEFMAGIEANTQEDVKSFLQQALDKGEEGLILKQCQSVYKPNARCGGWIKIKPDVLTAFYEQEIVDDLDLIIIGGYYGEGRRGGLISHFLLGVSVKIDNAEQPFMEFWSVGKVGTGYSMLELYNLLNQLRQNWQSTCPANIKVNKEKPDVWLEPKNSVLLQIRAACFIKSDLYATGLTLRFPRVQSIRYDKSYMDCTSLQELYIISQSSSIILTDQNYSHVEQNLPLKKKYIIKSPVLGSQFCGADVSHIVPSDYLFKGLELCILSGCESHSKQELELLAAKHGATLVQNPTDHTFVVLTSKVTVKVKNVMKFKNYNVAHINWFLNCLHHESLLNFNPDDLLSCTSKLSKEMEQTYDLYGDNYFIPATISSLRHIFESEKNQSLFPIMSYDDVIETQLVLFSTLPVWDLFHACHIYIDEYEELENEKTLLKPSPLISIHLDLLFCGAQLQTVLTGATHVVCLSNSSRIKKLQEKNHERCRFFHLVTHEWVLVSIEKQRRLDEKLYCPKIM